VSLLLILNLVFKSGTLVNASRPAPTANVAPAAQETRGDAGLDDLRAYDPGLRLDTWKEIRSRSIPKLSRNPFDFRRQPVAVEPEEALAAAPPPIPAGPPPIPLKALGYTEKSPGEPEAIVTDDDQIFIVHEGESFARKYRVLKITPTAIEVEDETTRQRARLPIAP
jgi:hypothetical protein